MSAATSFITSIPVFQGAQGKYYVVHGKKYHVNFPVAWAYQHITFQVGEYQYKSGPGDCGNCNVHGSIRGVFVGYCGNCLQYYHDTKHWRGFVVAPGLSVEMLEDNDMWAQYPYMSMVPKSEIGDEEGADLTDNGVNLERIAYAISDAEEEEEANEVARLAAGIYAAQEETRFDRDSRLIYPEHVLCEDRLDRKGLLYSDSPQDDDEVNEDVDDDTINTCDMDEEGEWHKVPDEAQGSNKNLITWMKKVGLYKEPVTKLSFGENLLPLIEHASNLESEEFRSEHPIKGLGNDYYSLDETLDHLLVINQKLDNESRFSERLKLEEELNHFENELRIHEAINKSSNITLRAYQTGKEQYEEENRPKREVAGEWNDEWMKSRREIAMNWDEIQQLQLTRGVAMTDEEINELLN